MNEDDTTPGPGDWLPQAHFGYVGAPLPAPSAVLDLDPDDEELAETPPDVVAMLGFDPLDLLA